MTATSSARPRILPCPPNSRHRTGRQSAPELVAEWKRLLSLDCPSEYWAGSELFTQGAAAREMFLLESGLVKITSMRPDGKGAILDLRYPGQWVEQSASILGVPYSVSATTVTRCEIYRFDIRRFRSRLANSLEASSLFVYQEAMDLSNQADALLRLKTLDARERLEHFIAELVPPMGLMNTRSPVRLRLPMKDHELAALIGVSKQHFSILKKQMIEAGEVISDSDYRSTMTVTREFISRITWFS